MHPALKRLLCILWLYTTNFKLFNSPLSRIKSCLRAIDHMAETGENDTKTARDLIRPFRENTEGDSNETTAHQRVKERYQPKDFLRSLAFDIFCITWLVPISYLLYLNLSDWVVGAGVGCRLPGLRNSCDVDREENDKGAAAAAKINKKDHEILGGL